MPHFVILETLYPSRAAPMGHGPGALTGHASEEGGTSAHCSVFVVTGEPEAIPAPGARSGSSTSSGDEPGQPEGGRGRGETGVSSGEAGACCVKWRGCRWLCLDQGRGHAQAMTGCLLCWGTEPGAQTSSAWPGGGGAPRVFCKWAGSQAVR